MASDANTTDPYKEKFRPADSLDKEVDAALVDLPLEQLYAFNKPGVGPVGGAAGSEQGAGGGGAGHAPGQPGHIPQKGYRRGRVVQINGDDVFIDFGGK